MFAFLDGKIALLEDDAIVININGVGYLVHVPLSLLANKIVGESIALYVQTIVREDAINIYGFSSLEHKKLFNLLITVQGVGARIALIMLAKITMEEMQKVILFEDINRLKEIPGVGAKMAQRLVNELKDKITKITTLNLDTTLQENSGGKISPSLNVKDAIIALQGLGYSGFEISKAIAKIQDNFNEDSKTEDIIKAVLKVFAQGL